MQVPAPFEVRIEAAPKPRVRWPLMSLAPRRPSTRRQLAWLFAAYVALATLATFALP